ncbi:hypothetical protein ACWD7M_16280 [Streptomyces griseus]
MITTEISASIAECEREINIATHSINSATATLSGARADHTRATRLLKRCVRAFAVDRHNATLTRTTDVIARMEALIAESTSDINHYSAELARLRALATTTTENETPMTDTTPTAPVTLPAAFCDWFNMTNLIENGDDEGDAEFAAISAAYQAGTTTPDGTTLNATRTALNGLQYFAETLYTASTSGDNDENETAAAELLLARIATARRELKATPTPVDTPAKLTEWERDLIAAAPALPVIEDTPADRAAMTAYNATTAPAAPRTPDFRGITRADVADAVPAALDAMSDDDRTIVDGKAPSVILGLSFRRAQTAWSANRTPSTAEERTAYEHTANLASAAMIFEKEDDPAAARTAMADHTRIENEERAAETARRDAAYARILESQWRDAPTFGAKGYQVRTEERGHGIVAVYVKGPASEIKSIERTSRAYARNRLTFAPGMSMGPLSGGGALCDGGATYISQDIYATQPLTPRED